MSTDAGNGAPETAPEVFPETADIETSNDDYATRFRGAVGAWLLATQERGTLGLLRNLPKGSTVLDVGGGHAQLAGPLCREGYEVTVLGSAESCRHRLEPVLSGGGKCRFLVGNVVALPFEDKSFNAVVCFRLLTHCGQWPTLVRELCRVSRGPVVVDYPTSQSLNAVAPALFEAKKKVEKNTRTWRLFRHAEVRDAFAAAGFAETGRFGQFFLPMVLHRALRCRPLSAALESLCRAAGLSRAWGTPVIVRMESTTDLRKAKTP
jgi:2-polyprenyl-3-methyl-5-hydroxy-6-metoxy-1,4-benzoquinol methylase